MRLRRQPDRTETYWADDEEQADGRRRLPRGARIGLIAAAVAGGLVLFVVAAVMAVILSGPTELGFVRDGYRRALQERLGDDYVVSVDKATIDVDPVLGLVADIDNTNVVDDTGATVARIPSTRLAIDPLALFGFRVTVTAVELRSAEFALVRPETGPAYLGTQSTAQPPAESAATPHAPAAQAGPDGGFPEIASVLRILDQGLEAPLDLAVNSDFRTLSLIGGTINIWDAVDQRERHFGETDFDMTADAAKRSLVASLATSGYAGRWTATLERTEDLETGAHEISGVFSQLTLADFFPQFGGDSATSADIPLYGRATVDFSGDGSLEAASLRLDVGAGVFTTGGEDASVLLDEATIKLNWDVAGGVINVEPSSLFFGQTRGIVTGSIRPSGPVGHGRYAFSLDAADAVLAARDANAPPVVARIAVSGIYDLPGRLLDIGNLSIETESGSLALAGTVGFEDWGPSLALAASVSPMPVTTFKQMWVPFLASGARHWVEANMTGGTIESGQFEATVPAGVLGHEHPQMPDDGLSLNLRVKDASFRTIGDLPPVSGASGNVVVSGKTLGIDLDGGRIDLASGRSVSVDAGAFAIDDVFNPSPTGVVELQLSGPAAALGEIADARPLNVLASRGLAPDDLSGSASAAISLRLPLDLEEDEIGGAMVWKVTVTGKRLASAQPIEGRTFKDADVTITVVPDNFAVTGKATIDGVEADVSISQPLGQQGESSGRGQQLARLSLDKAARDRLGLGLDDIIDGTVGTQISSLADSDGQHYDLDLGPARLTIPGLGWTKGIGVPATLSFDLIPIERGQRVENIVLEGDGFGFHGSALLDSGTGLASAEVDHFALRPGDAMAFTLTATDKGYAIKAKGDSFDARGLISESTESGEGDGGPDISVEAEIARVTGFNDETITGFKATYVAKDGDPTRISVTGTLGRAPVVVDFTDTRKGASLEASAGAGSLLRFLNVYNRIGGGQLAINARRSGPSGPLSGKATIADFDILNEPAVQRAISSAPTKQRIDPARIHFDQMVARFHIAGEAITIEEALLRGQAVGATFNGRVDLRQGHVLINGTYLPLYALNNVFGRVPVLGLVLGGGNRGGLIGVTFRVEGPLGEPQVFFNPLSAVAPGIFRKIFEFR
ncbi:MAG: hypothetical protein KDJ88_00560 [Bauldia sp.]|nr:hypothetical protein [Bauldia sp.]